MALCSKLKEERSLQSASLPGLWSIPFFAEGLNTECPCIVTVDTVPFHPKHWGAWNWKPPDPFKNKRAILFNFLLRVRSLSFMPSFSVIQRSTADLWKNSCNMELMKLWLLRCCDLLQQILKRKIRDVLPQTSFSKWQFLGENLPSVWVKYFVFLNMASALVLK